MVQLPNNTGIELKPKYDINRIFSPVYEIHTTIARTEGQVSMTRNTNEVTCVRRYNIRIHIRYCIFSTEIRASPRMMARMP